MADTEMLNPVAMEGERLMTRLAEGRSRTDGAFSDQLRNDITSLRSEMATAIMEQMPGTEANFHAVVATGDQYYQMSVGVTRHELPGAVPGAFVSFRDITVEEQARLLRNESLAASLEESPALAEIAKARAEVSQIPDKLADGRTALLELVDLIEADTREVLAQTKADLDPAPFIDQSGAIPSLPFDHLVIDTRHNDGHMVFVGKRTAAGHDMSHCMSVNGIYGEHAWSSIDRTPGQPREMADVEESTTHRSRLTVDELQVIKFCLDVASKWVHHAIEHGGLR